MNEKLEILKIEFSRAKNQLFALKTYAFDYDFINYTSKEPKIGFDINKMLERYKYHVDRLIYHAERVILSLDNFNLFISRIDNKTYYTSWNDDTLYFEFDAFIATSSSIFEEPFKKDAYECFNKETYKKFEEIFPNKNNADSLLWRLTIIRNRIVHPDHPTYDKEGNRYDEFSSKAGNMVKVENGKLVEITTQLIDIALMKPYKKILQEEVINKTKEIRNNFKKRDCQEKCAPNLPDIHQILFNENGNKTKGKGMITVQGTNLIESFISISHEIMAFIIKVNNLYNINYNELLGECYEKDRIFFINNLEQFYAWGKANEKTRKKNI